VMGSHDGAAEAVRVRLLGGFSVSVGSRVVEANGWRRRSAASLVKVLALARGHRLRRDQMLDILWPELDERTAAGNLHRALHFARRAFEPDASRSSARYLALVDGMVSLCPEEPLWVDAEEFERAADRATPPPTGPPSNSTRGSCCPPTATRSSRTRAGTPCARATWHCWRSSPRCTRSGGSPIRP
jgi:hypothetical protein